MGPGAQVLAGGVRWRSEVPRPGRVRDRTYTLLYKRRITDGVFCELLVGKGWTWVTLDRRGGGIVVGRHRSEGAALAAADLFGGRPERVPGS